MRCLGFLALSWLLLIATVAWAGETSTVTANFANDVVTGASDIDGGVSAETRSLAEQILNHLSNTNPDDVSQITADGPLLSYSLVIDIDNPDPIGTAQGLLENGRAFQFDFESGLQEWTLDGSARRVNTQVLGGEWAIFGDGLVAGGASISLELALSEVAAVEIDALVFSPLFRFRLETGGEPSFFVGNGNEALRVELNEEARSLDRLVIRWFVFPTEGPLPPPPDTGLAFIDNITLVPIPEPSTLLMVLGGLWAGALIGQRRRRS